VSDLVIANTGKIATPSQFDFLARMNVLLNEEAVEKLTACAIKTL
jgi:hypothetical protein